MWRKEGGFVLGMEGVPVGVKVELSTGGVG